jgi:hypothetical protein
VNTTARNSTEIPLVGAYVRAGAAGNARDFAAHFAAHGPRPCFPRPRTLNSAHLVVHVASDVKIIRLNIRHAGIARDDGKALPVAQGTSLRWLPSTQDPLPADAHRRGV